MNIIYGQKLFLKRKGKNRPPTKKVPKGCKVAKRICIICLVSKISKREKNYEMKTCKDCLKKKETK